VSIGNGDFLDKAQQQRQTPIISKQPNTSPLIRQLPARRHAFFGEVCGKGIQPVFVGFFEKQRTTHSRK